VTGRRFGLAVLAVVALAAGLRATCLGRWPFGSDEIGTFEDVELYLHPPAVPANPDQAVPRVIPLSMAALDLGHRVFGTDERGCRVLPAVFGVGLVAVAAVGLAGLVGRGTAVTAGLWLAVGVEPIFYSQYHRFYTLTAVLCGAVTIVAAWAVRRGSGGLMAAACGLAGLAVASHTLAGVVFPVLVAGAFAAAAVGGTRRAVIVAAVGATLAAGVAAVVILPVVRAKAGLTHWEGATSVKAVQSLVVQASLPVCVLALPGLVLLWRRDRQQAAFWAAAAGGWAGAGVALPGVLPFHSAYTFPLALPVFVLAGFAVVELAAAVADRAGQLPAGLVWAGLPLLNLPGLASYYQDGNRHDFRTACAYVAERFGPADAVVCNEPTKLSRYGPSLDPHQLIVLPTGTPADVLPAVPPGGRLWVICSGGRGGIKPSWQPWVYEHCRLRTVVAARRFDYHEFGVWVFATPGPETPGK
jgi:hypothetical protein